MPINKYKKYNSVPVREWPNSAYSFNRNNEKLLLYKKDTTNKIIKDYFNLIKKERSVKSRRMKMSRRIFTLLRLFNSKVTIKQNNDKVNISLHTFNKRKTKMNKNMFSFNKYLSRFKKYNFFTSKVLKRINKHDNINLLKNTQINNNNLILQASKFNLTNYLRAPRSTSSLHLIKNKNARFYNLKSISSGKGKRKIVIKRKGNLLYNKIIKNFPWSLERKRIILYKIISLRAFYNSILKTFGLSIQTYLNKNLYVITFRSLTRAKISKENNKRLIIKLPHRFNKYNNLTFSTGNRKRIKTLKELANLKFERYIYINNILEEITNQILTKYKNSSLNDNNVITLKDKLYNEFKRYNTKRLFLRFFGKQYLILKNIYKLYIDNDKYTSMTNSLKYIFNKIYNKEVALNMFELKYIHLNADMFSNAVIIKLASMKVRLKKVIKKIIKLVKLNKSQSNVSLESNVLYAKDKSNGKPSVTFGDLIGEMYDPNLSNTKSNNNKMYNIKTPVPLTSNTSAKRLEENMYLNINAFDTKTKEVIKNLKHKWVTGIKLEAKGRLRNRFTAGRTTYRYMTKGNLRSKLTYTNQNNKVLKKNPYIPLFRGILMPNLQYIRKNGRRKIGSFGIKLWINNN